MVDTKPFGALPQMADTDVVKPYTINIPEEKISRMKQLVELSNIAEICYENSQPGDSREYGVRHDWIIAMRERWLNKFDWKEHESHLNTFPHFVASIEDSTTSPDPYSIHFMALFSTREDALPILFPHGWPGSFLEFIPMLSQIKHQYNNDASSLPYHIIVPSLPGFGLSSSPPVQQPVTQDGELFGMESVARIFNTLMAKLFGPSTKYVAQGGDIGSRITRILAALHANCVAAHLNFSPVPQPEELKGEELDARAKKGIERYEWFKSKGSAYALFQATKPGTLGFVLSSNPLAVLAWIGEKFLDWTDPASFPADPPHSSASSQFAEDILLGASLYWLSGRIATTFYTYRESFALSGTAPSGHANPRYRIQEPKMMGFSWFPMELAPIPISWIGATGNLIWSKQHDKGGHFAAFEQPHALWSDVEEFVQVVKQNLSS
ncbi:hypothetical protein H2198_001824 [Neophaeococcomyces mojaviensis]|uniref:Uncharacterized protein n=1 Tax=Neophaeococcomyces mojaviensis TaxID=3383035 RepID=A0ACC3AFW8_9EURO|nr:hypothetical protein H2198_001824 [Knufia sp. JES_112]